MAKGRVIVFNREIHLDVDGSLAVGDTFNVVRGNGPREGDRMGTATVVAFEDDGEPVLEVVFDGHNVHAFEPLNRREIPSVCRICGKSLADAIHYVRGD